MPTRPHSAALLLASTVLAACGSASVGGDPVPSTPQKLLVASASRQTGLVGAVVASQPVVKVTDASGRPMAGVTVTFAVTSGGGSVAPDVVVTGPDGLAATTWRLGTAGDQQLRATSDAVPGATAMFSAQALAGGGGYHIDLRLLTTATDSQWAAFTSAADRISQVIAGGVDPMTLDGRSCDGSPLSGSSQLLILVRLTSIDGRGGVLGQAGPCILHGAGTGAGLPAAGVMEFDTADLAALESSGKLRSTILHEMLHVVGFGTVWDGLVSGATTTDSMFLGAQALGAAQGANGAPSTWTAVPLENCVGHTGCGAGTRDAHWLETTFGDELMTGWLSGTAQPLSRTTAASLADLGYDVNLDAADAFTIHLATLLAPEAGAEPPEYLQDDVLHLPIEIVP